MFTRQIQENTLIRKPGATSWCAVLAATFVLGVCCAMASAAEPSWQPVKGHLMTRWAKEVSPTNVLPDVKPDVPVRGNWKREFTVSKKYLVMPMRDEGRACTVELTVADKKVRIYECDIAPDKDKITVKFIAPLKGTAGGVFGVRILKVKK